MSAGRSLPAIATRGKEFAVARFSHVTADAQLIVSPNGWTARSDAEKAAGAFDARLEPTIILVDRRAS